MNRSIEKENELIHRLLMIDGNDKDQCYVLELDYFNYVSKICDSDYLEFLKRDTFDLLHMLCQGHRYMDAHSNEEG